MGYLIHSVSYLRSLHTLVLLVRLLVIILMIVGAWVATRNLEFPETVSINDKMIHATVFVGFAVLMDFAYARYPFWLWQGLPLLIYGALIEILQYFTPDRTFSVLDWLADFSGILLYFIIKELVIRLNAKQAFNL